MQDEEILKEFLIESHENLARMEKELVDLEERPGDAALLGSIFRSLHTLKGTCGFFGFGTLEQISHSAENILSQLRTGQRKLNPVLVSLILETVDVIKKELAAIEATSAPTAEPHADLIGRLQAAASARDDVPAAPAAQPEPAEAEAAQRSGGGVADSTVRVDVGLLDKLMNLVGELVLARNQIVQYSSRQEDGLLTASSQRLNIITTELQEGVMKTRMQPIGTLWTILPRLVRDLAKGSGKQIQLDMDGAETELDRTILEGIKDPLTHLIRNCCDHGIERPEERVRKGKPARGRLGLRAFHEGGHVNIEISDDGAGIDTARVRRKAVEKGLLRGDQAEKLSERETLNLVFNPGLSTAERVTNISGRGVGMDVVKTNVEKIGGVVDLTSRPGHGTTVKIKIPLTLAIIPGLVVSSGGETFVIPQVSLLELIRLEGESGRAAIERIHDTAVYRRRGKLLPVAYLNDVLKLPRDQAADIISIVVLQAEDRQFGLVVDSISDTQEIVVKPLGKQLKGLSCYAGATIMGDGRVALILDVLGIGQRSGVLAESRDSSRADLSSGMQRVENERQSYLLFRTGRFGRLAVPLALVARLEEFPQAEIEEAGGTRVVQYRGQILPLIPLGRLLDPESEDTAGKQDPAQALVFTSGQRAVGLLVDHILDIVDETITTRHESTHSGLLASAVIGQKVTDLLDLDAVLREAAAGWLETRTTAENAACVLLAENSAFLRGLMRTYIEGAGYRALEASSVQDALTRLHRERVDIVLGADDLGGSGVAGLVEQMRQQASLERIPVILLGDAGAESASPQNGFAACLAKSDREGMLRSLGELAAAIRDREPVSAGIGERN